jgi:N utilization substance protein B
MPLTKREQRVRRRARARTLQAIYAWDVAGAGALAPFAGRLWDDVALGAEERAFATPIVRVLGERGGDIDEALKAVTTNWRLERIGAIERAVLRLAGAELLGADVPPRVVIQEAVQLTERYASPESARFVNGVLDALARHLRRL